MASRPRTGGTAINREGRPLLSLQTPASSRGRRGSQEAPCKSTVSCSCQEEGRIKALSFQTCHNLPASGGLGSRGTMAWRHPSRELRQEANSSCQNQSNLSSAHLALQPLCFISESLHSSHRTPRAQGLCKPVTDFCSAQKPLTYIVFLPFAQVLLARRIGMMQVQSK